MPQQPDRLQRAVVPWLRLAAASLGLVSASAPAGEPAQLSFSAFSLPSGTCELNELGFMTQPKAPRFKGTIEAQPRDPVCRVKIPRETFDRLYQYCSLAAIEVATTGYVCGVTHFENANVEFSYGFKYGLAAPPLCSFVCPRALP